MTRRITADKQLRQTIAYQFELEAGQRLKYAVNARLRNHCYHLTDVLDGTEMIAMVLPTSFDFYEYRLNAGKQRVSALIVDRHNAVVPIKVISVSQVKTYAPLDVPDVARRMAKRRNAEESRLLLSKLILNFEGAYEELAAMDERSRQRYHHLKQMYLTPKIGRPIAS